jgi:hypothetical protein
MKGQTARGRWPLFVLLAGLTAGWGEPGPPPVTGGPSVVLVS